MIRIYFLPEQTGLVKASPLAVAQDRTRLREMGEQRGLQEVQAVLEPHIGEYDLHTVVLRASLLDTDHHVPGNIAVP